MLSQTVYQARCLLPITRPPIEGGWILIRNGLIAAIGDHNQSPPQAPIDLGDVAILPAMVNAHTHLEFSYLHRPIGNPGVKLHDWIGEVVRSRDTSMQGDLFVPDDTVKHGIKLCHDTCTSLVGDIATTPYPMPDVSTGSKVELIAFAEVLGLSANRSDAKLLAAQTHVQRFVNCDNVRPGISPHAPYSTPRDVVRRCVEQAIQYRVPVSMHVAESTEERQLIERGDGPFADRLREIQIFSDDLFPWGNDATKELLALLSKAPQAMIIHGNDLRDDEIDLISKQRQMTVVYCPRTHAFFGHREHPVKKLIAAGVRVAIGTDSLASNPDLSIWGEVQWLLDHREDIDWQAILAMATLHGADALARKDLGRLEIGAKARLITIPIDRLELREAFVRGRPSWIEID